jgi:transcriptional regulator with XRE-family HTH domain
MKRFLEKTSISILGDVEGKTGKEWDVVLIEAGLSLNNKFYSEQLLEASVSHFEGVKCCAFLEGDDFNHRSQENIDNNPSGSAKNTIGWFKDVRFGEFKKPDGSTGKGIIARLHILEGQDWLMKGMKDAFAHGKTDLLGFSIDAHGDGHEGFREGKDVFIVESITQVESTDVVTDPAAGGRFMRIAASVENDKKGEQMKDFRKLAENFGMTQKEGESDDDFKKRVLSAKMKEAGTPLGNMLRKAMDAKGLSTADLGKAAGIDAGTVAQILDGSIKRPPNERLKGFARVTGISFDQLLNAIPSNIRESIDGAYISDEEKDLEMKTAKELKEAQDKLAEDQAKFEETQKASRIKESQILVKEALLTSELPEQAKKKITEKFDGQEEVTAEKIQEAIKTEKDYIASFKEQTGGVDGLGDAHDDGSDALKKTKVGDGLKEKLGKAWDGMYEMDDIDGVPRFNSLKEAWRAYNKGNLKALGGSNQQVSRHIFESMARGLPGEGGLNWDDGNPYEEHSNKLKESWNRSTSQSLRESTATGDFSIGFGDSLYRRLQKETNMDPRSDWRDIVSSIENLQDATNTFRVVRTGESKRLPVVNQKAPYQEINPSTTEEVETMTPAKYGGLEIVTWESVLADNMGIIRKIPRKLARASNLTIHGLIWDEIELNPTMQDGDALFHSNHSNDLGDVALTYDNVVVGVKGLRKQTAFESDEKMGLGPHFLLTSVDQEALAEEIIGSTAKATSAEDSTIKNVLMTKFRMKALGTLGLGTAAARLLYWYVCASPKDADTIAVGFLGGRSQPDIFVQGINTPTAGSMFDADMITYKIRQVAAATIIDHRWIQRGAKS